MKLGNGIVNVRPDIRKELLKGLLRCCSTELELVLVMGLALHGLPRFFERLLIGSVTTLLADLKSSSLSRLRAKLSLLSPKYKAGMGPSV